MKIVPAQDRSRRPQTVWLAVVTFAAISMAVAAWWTFRRHVDAGAGWSALGMELGLVAGPVVIVVLPVTTWSVKSGKVGLVGTLAVAALLIGVWMLVNASSKY